MDGNKEKLTGLIKDKVFDTGFDLCGIAPAHILEENGEVLKEWVASGMNAGMGYLSRNIEKRIDPGALFPGSRSVIVTGLNYYSEKKQGGGEVPVISRYVYGKDYHEIIMNKLGYVIEFMRGIEKGSESRAFVDSSPVLEKAWASRAGLGWQGKHSILINSKIGSFFFLGVILTTLELEHDQLAEDRCGSCRLCIDGCPTGAINGNRTIDAKKCIAYLTTDNKSPVEEKDIEKLGGRIAGCDRCQEVCPWNKHAVPHNHPEFEIPEELKKMSADDWLNLSAEDYKRLFGNSAINRRKYEVFIQNVINVTKYLKEHPLP